MAAQSSGAFTADPPPVGSAGNSNSLSCRSSQSSGSGHLRPAAEARSRYRLTLDWLMEQLRAISLCSSPRTYRNRSTSLIWRMDKLLCGIRFLLRSRRNPHGLSNVAFLLQLGKPDHGTLISTPVPNYGSGLFASPELLFTCPETLFTSPESASTSPESLSTSPRNSYSHRSG